MPRAPTTGVIHSSVNFTSMAIPLGAGFYADNLSIFETSSHCYCSPYLCSFDVHLFFFKLKLSSSFYLFSPCLLFLSALIMACRVFFTFPCQRCIRLLGSVGLQFPPIWKRVRDSKVVLQFTEMVCVTARTHISPCTSLRGASIDLLSCC